MQKSRLAPVLTALILAVSAPLTHAQSFGPAPYSITDLGPLAGNTDSAAYGLNSSGQVAGYSNLHGQYPNIKTSTLWTHGVPRAIPTLAGSSVVGSEFDRASAINNNGWVVGGCVTPAGFLPHAFLWTSANGIQDLGSFPGGRTSFATGINSSGAVVGYADNAIGDGMNHAFLWTSGLGLRDLGTFGGQSSSAAGINSANQVVGVADTIDQYQHAFLWSSAHGLQDLGAEPGDYVSSAAAINDAGSVVGSSGSGYSSHAFLWTAAHGMQDLGTLGGVFTSGYGINTSGQVVGSSLPNNNIGSPDAFLWDAAHGMRDLNTMISDPAWRLTQATAINSSGQITGVGSINGVSHGFLLTPTPPIALVLSPASVVNGTFSYATITLGAPATSGPNPFNGGAIAPGAYVRLTSSKPEAVFASNINFAPDGQAYLYIPQGQWQATAGVYAVGTVAANTSSTITASFSGGSQSATLTITPTLVQSLVIAPNSVVGGGQCTGTVTLATPAYDGLDPYGALEAGAYVKLTSSSPGVAFGGSSLVHGSDGTYYVHVALGDTQATFNIVTDSAPPPQRVTVSASIGASVKTASLTITQTLVQSLVVSPAAVLNGSGCTGTVTLATPAFAGPDPFGSRTLGAYVKLSSSVPAARFGDNTLTLADGSVYVYVPYGATQATFGMTTSFVAATQHATITAAFGASTKTSTLTINPTLIQSILLTKTPYVAGQSAPVTTAVNGDQLMGIVTLATPAFLGMDPNGNVGPGVYVKLASTASAATFGGNALNFPGGPSYVYIPQGQTQATFTVNTGWVPASKSVSLTASLYSGSKSVSLAVNPTLVQSISVSPNSVVSGGAPSTGTVTLATPAFVGPDPNGVIGPGVYLRLTTTDPAVFYGGNAFLAGNGSYYVYIPQGSVQATFLVTTGFVSASTTAGITATFGASVKTANLTIKPTTVLSIALSPATITGGGQSLGTVTLTAPALLCIAPDGSVQPGAYVKLTSSASALTFGGALVGSDGASYVYIPQGATQTTFNAIAGSVAARTSASITAALNGSPRSASLTINP